MSFETFIGGRYLRAKQKQTFISLITFLSIAGVTVGVMALIVVIAVIGVLMSTVVLLQSGKGGGLAGIAGGGGGGGGGCWPQPG